MPSEGKSAGRDAPAESKYAPASSASRGAKGGGLEDDAEDMKLPELVTKFAHLVMSERYRANIEAWKRKHADEFVDANAEDEQKLEWTAAFQLYVKLVEGELEGFCQTNQVEPSEVFGVIGEAMNGPLLDEEFLPAILQVADYDYFLTQMALLANEKRYSELAEDRSRAADDPTCVSGSWALDTKQSTLSNVDEFLSATRVPKVFRGLAKGFIYKNNVLNIIQANGRITLYFNSPTGRRKEVYHTDGEKHDMVNVWGKSVPVRCTVARDGTVVVVNEAPANLPRGSTIVTAYTPFQGGRSLKSRVEIEVPNRRPVVFEVWYGRVSDMAQKKKGKKGAGAGAGGAAGAKGGGGGAKAGAK